MAAAEKTKRKLPTGIRERHARGCGSRRDRACSCRPSYEAWVYLKREDRKVRRTFDRLSDAKAWRQDASVAARRNKLRGPSTTDPARSSRRVPRRHAGRVDPKSIR